MKNLFAVCVCFVTFIGFYSPAFAETTIPEWERREVASFWQGFIPAAANAAGRFDTHYKTRVVIFNPTSRDYSIAAVLCGTNGPVGQKDISIQSGEYLTWDDFLGEVFDYRGGGAVWLKAPGKGDDFYMTAEVYTDSPNGRFITTVVNGRIPTFISGTEPNFNVGITVNQNRRTNIGVWTLGDRTSKVEAKVFDSNGMPLQTIGFDLPAWAWQQKSISVPVENGYLRWEINGESEDHFFYAVEVDNQSNDGTLSWSVPGSGVEDGGGASSLAPADQAAFNDLVVGKRAVRDDSAGAYVDFISPGRLKEFDGSEIYYGSYTYRKTGPNTGTLTTNYDDGDRCTTRLTFSTATSGRYTFNCDDESSASGGWRLVDIPEDGGGEDQPDLVVRSVRVDNDTPDAGESFTLSATVQNQGDGRSGSTTLRYYRSSNSTISSGDTEVGKDSVRGLAASATSDESIRLTAPSSAGTYYYGACVDSVSGESRTSNNCSDGVRVEVSDSGGGDDGDDDFESFKGLKISNDGSVTLQVGGIRLVAGNAGCISGGGRFNGQLYDYHWTAWQRDTGSGWKEVSGSRKTNRLCGYDLSSAGRGKYRLVGDMTLAGVRGRYKSENEVTKR